MRQRLREHGCVFTLLVLAGLSLLAGIGCQQADPPNLTYQPTGTPRLVELGTAACIPCALMRPALDELKAQYAGRLEVEVIDTLYDPGVKTQYNAPFCATQIYIAASGKELYRHVGYASKEEILANWRRLGVDLSASPQR